MNKCEPWAFELNESQIKELLKLNRFNKNDIFYDLGCATGKIVRAVVKQTNTKKAIGIEANFCYYRKSWELSIKELQKKDLLRIDFWLSNINNSDTFEKKPIIDYSNATVIFANLDESVDDLNDYKEWKIWNKAKIIKKDIPLVGYDSIANRSNHDCWFYLMKPPFKKLKKIDWIKSVHPDFETFDDIFDYYYCQIEKRMRDDPDESTKNSRKEAKGSLLYLQSLINERF